MDFIRTDVGGETMQALGFTAIAPELVHWTAPPWVRGELQRRGGFVSGRAAVNGPTLAGHARSWPTFHVRARLRFLQPLICVVHDVDVISVADT